MSDVADSLSTKIKSIEKSKKYAHLASHMYTILASDGSVDVDFITTSYLTEPEIIKLPAYAVEISYVSSWSASFGYTRTEHYTEYVKVYKNSTYTIEPKTRTKKVTDWSPVSGNDSGRFTLLRYAGSKHPDAKNLFPSFSEIGSTKLIDEKSLSEIKFNDISVVVKGLEGKIDYNITEFAKRYKKGDQQKDWSVSHNYDYTYDKYAFSVYIGQIVYGDKKRNIYFSSTAEGVYKFEKFGRSEVDNSFDDLSKNLRIAVAVGSAVILIGANSFSSNFSFYFAIAIAVGFWFYAKSCSNFVKQSDDNKVEKALESRMARGFIGEDSIIKDYDSGPEVEWRTDKGKLKFKKIAAYTFSAITLLAFQKSIFQLIGIQ